MSKPKKTSYTIDEYYLMMFSEYETSYKKSIGKFQKSNTVEITT